MPIEIRNGEKPSFTSFVGASALPSHTAAASPQNTPSLCSEMCGPLMDGSHVHRSQFHLRVISSAVPSISTTTGTHRCTSVKMRLQHRWSL